MPETKLIDGEVIPPHSAPALRPKSLEEQVCDQLGAEEAHGAIAICQRLATEAKGVGEIAAAVLGLNDDEQGRHAAKCRFYRLKVRSVALASLYARAREARADMLADEIVEIADAPLPSDPALLKAEVEARKLKVDARKWAAGKFNRSLYSDDPQRPGVQVTINNHDDGAAALEEIRRRLARKRQAMLGGGNGTTERQ